MKIKSNRKLKNGVALADKCYDLYQVDIIIRRMKELVRKEVKWMEEVHCFNYIDLDEYLKNKYNKLSNEAAIKYIQRGLAVQFEEHHRVNENTKIIVSEMGQIINS